MMIFYNLGIYMMGGIMRIASLFNKKAKLWVDGRRKIFSRMEQAISPDAKVVWVHCASLGEFEQGRPLIEAIKKEHPSHKILLTFFSPSGYEIRKNYEGADFIFYLPTDTPPHVRKFIKIAHPEIAVFVKYEFWLNYLKYLKKYGCRTFIISAIFRRDSSFFKWYGGMFRKALKSFERLFVQNKQSEELLNELGITNVTIAGDTRFDRVADIASHAKKIEIVERFSHGFKTLVAGSTWPADEDILAKAITDYPDTKFIIAPHEMDFERIDKFIAGSPRKAVRYTFCDENTDLKTAQVLIIDTIGILSSIYQYASYVFIGGGFGVGIHNTLEAATFGLPIAFGPNYQKFQEARDMIELGAAQSISDYDQFNNWLSGLITNPELYQSVRKIAADYVARNIGATKKIMSVLFPPK